MKAPIVFDSSYVQNHFSPIQNHSLTKKRESAKRRLNEDCTQGKIGFVDLPYQKELTHFQSLSRSIRKTCTDLIVIGIGGSSLGAKAAIQALGGDLAVRIHFLENPNPSTVHALLKKINLKKTAINVISKSGTTLETLSLFFILFDKIKENKKVIITTENKDNYLNRLAKEYNLPQLTIPENVGGRYSVLSSVGLFPMAVNGIDIQELLSGARWMDQNRVESYNYAIFSYAAHKILKKSQAVFFPYDERLKTFGDWLSQLWAESLAKTEYAGSTPLTAIGPMDQHSLLQLFLQGPRDKAFTTLEIKDYEHSIKIPGAPYLKEFSYLKNTSLEKILHTEQMVTEESLIKTFNPVYRLTLPQLNAYTLGALFYHFELSTALTGYLYHINPFNQPAVEEGKLRIEALLKNTI